MSLKVKRSKGARSSSPMNNWKSSSKWIGPTLVSWLRPSKEEHPRYEVPTSQTRELWWCLWSKDCGHLDCRDGGLFTCCQGWTALGRGTCPVLLERLCRHMVEDNETRGREKPWLHLGVLQGTHQDWICPKELRLHLEVQISWPCECHKWKLEVICEGLLRTHVWDLAHAWVRPCVLICDGASNLG